MSIKSQRTDEELRKEWENAPNDPGDDELGYDRIDWDCMPVENTAEGETTFVFTPENPTNWKEEDFVSAKLHDIKTLSQWR